MTQVGPRLSEDGSVGGWANAEAPEEAFIDGDGSKDGTEGNMVNVRKSLKYLKSVHVVSVCLTSKSKYVYHTTAHML